MPKPAQVKTAKIKPLDPQKVKIALAIKGWSQAFLARRIERSITAVNLTINHHSFPEVAEEIRSELDL